MRKVRIGIGVAVAATLAACEPLIEPAAEATLDVPAPSFAVHNRVVQRVTGSANFHWTRRSTGDEYWRTSSLSARKYADGSVAGTYETVIHGFAFDKARITCFTIRGNEAWLGVVIEDSSGPSRIGSEYVLYLMDNGGGSHTPDRSTALPRLSSTGFATLEEYCEATPEMNASWIYELEEGNLRVTRYNPVVEQVTGNAKFHRTPNSGETYWHTAAFTARRYADGSVKGGYQAVTSAGPSNGLIHCFTVIGNEAWLGVIVERSANPNSPLGTPRIVYVMDNGEGGVVPDRSTAFPPLRITGLPDLDTYCAETPEIRSTSVFDLEAGNVQILP